MKRLLHSSAPSDGFRHSHTLWRFRKTDSEDRQYAVVTCIFSENMSADELAPEVSSSFTDVSDDAWYADVVKWTVHRKITSGTSVTTFSPDANCTRGQIVMFLNRVLKWDNEKTDIKILQRNLCRGIVVYGWRTSLKTHLCRAVVENIPLILPKN